MNLLCREAPSLDLIHVEKALALSFPSFPADMSCVRASDDHRDELLFTIAGIPMAIVCVGQMLPAPEVEDALQASLQAATLRRKIDAHRGHLMIACVKKPGDSREAVLFSMILTLLTAALSKAVGGLAVQWLPGNVLSDAVDFEAASKTLYDTRALPLEQWIRLEFLQGERSSDSFGMASHGLHVFVGHEIRLSEITGGAPRAARAMLTVLNYLLTTNSVLEDGQTCDIPDGGAFSIKRESGLITIKPSAPVRQEA